MPLSLAQIENEVDQLPQKEIQQLLEYIHERQEHDRIWGEEAQRRLESYKAGKSKAYPAEEVFKNLKAELAARRK